MVLLLILLFVIGVCIGSFLNVVIDRLPQKRSIWRGRSVCESCHKKLTASELIPVLSYIVLGGRCKNCKGKIPARLTLVEVLTGILFVAAFLYLPVALYTLPLVLAIVCISIAVFFIDLKFGIIPDELIILFTVLSLLLIIVFMPEAFLNHLAAGLASFALFLALFLVTGGKGLGFGDVKLVFAMGFFLGAPLILVAFYFAFLTGAVVSIILMLYGKKSLKSAVPFGPFLTSGTVFAYFFGNSALQIAFSLLFG